jgi:hypothetical protein
MRQYWYSSDVNVALHSTNARRMSMAPVSPMLFVGLVFLLFLYFFVTSPLMSPLRLH